MKVATRRLLEEQIAVVVVLESGKKDEVPLSRALITVNFDFGKINSVKQIYRCFVLCTQIR